MADEMIKYYSGVNKSYDVKMQTYKPAVKNQQKPVESFLAEKVFDWLEGYSKDLGENGLPIDKLQDRVFEERRQGNLFSNNFNVSNSLSSYLVYESSIDGFVENLKSKRRNSSSTARELNSEIEALAKAEIKKMGKGPAFIDGFASLVKNKSKAELVVSESAEKVCDRLNYAFKNLSSYFGKFKEYSKPEFAEDVAPSQKFIVNSLTYFNVLEKAKVKDAYHPLVPIIATCILARGLSNPSENSAVDEIENFLEAYIIAAAENGKTTYKNKHSITSILDDPSTVPYVVKQALDRVDRLALIMDRTLNNKPFNNDDEDEKIPIGGQYLHDIALWKQLHKRATEGKDVATDIDAGGKHESSLRFFMYGGISDDIFSKEDRDEKVYRELKAKASEAEFLKAFNSGDRKQIWAVLKCKQDLIAGTFNKDSSKTDTRATDVQKKLALSVYVTQLIKHSDLRKLNKESLTFANRLLEAYSSAIISAKNCLTPETFNIVTSISFNENEKAIREAKAQIAGFEDTRQGYTTLTEGVGMPEIRDHVGPTQLPASFAEEQGEQKLEEIEEPQSVELVEEQSEQKTEEVATEDW